MAAARRIAHDARSWKYAATELSCYHGECSFAAEIFVDRRGGGVLSAVIVDEAVVGILDCIFISIASNLLH